MEGMLECFCEFDHVVYGVVCRVRSAEQEGAPRGLLEAALIPAHTHRDSYVHWY
jgi:hypothetical protein